MSAIIDELQQFENSLMGPLLKVKVMASRLGNVKLLEWVNNEINGYEVDKVPDILRYRNVYAPLNQYIAVNIILK